MTESERAQVVAALEEVESHLMNLQPHIEQSCYPKMRPFIDSHVDVAAAAAKTALAIMRRKREPVAWQWLTTAHFRKDIPEKADRADWNPLYRD